jgi:chorismate dehydratase
MHDIKISVVSYLNASPFVHGLRNSGLFDGHELLLDVPSDCARKFISGESDIALVPVATLPELKNYRLLDRYCIGSRGKVKTVGLFSNLPLVQIKKIFLDPHSLTSVNLAKILARNFWHIKPEWATVLCNDINPETYESVVAIGDKTFGLYSKYTHIYDFGLEWEKFAGLPFVFACWVAKQEISDKIIALFSSAIEWGIENKSDLWGKNSYAGLKDADVKDYLERNIDFTFDQRKMKGLNYFLELMHAL